MAVEAYESERTVEHAGSYRDANGSKYDYESSENLKITNDATEIAELFSLLRTGKGRLVIPTDAHATDAETKVAKTANSFATDLPSGARALLDYVEGTVAAIQTSGHESQDLSLVSKLLADEAGWKTLFKADFDRAVELRRELTELEAQLKS